MPVTLGFDIRFTRNMVCHVLNMLPEASNVWPFEVEVEVGRLLAECPWWKVYDIAESFYEVSSVDRQSAAIIYQRTLNQLFIDHGIGWEMRNGKIVARGSEAFEAAGGW